MSDPSRQEIREAMRRLRSMLGPLHPKLRAALEESIGAYRRVHGDLAVGNLVGRCDRTVDRRGNCPDAWPTSELGALAQADPAGVGEALRQYLFGMEIPMGEACRAVAEVRHLLKQVTGFVHEAISFPDDGKIDTVEARQLRVAFREIRALMDRAEAAILPIDMGSEG